MVFLFPIEGWLRESWYAIATLAASNALDAFAVVAVWQVGEPGTTPRVRAIASKWPCAAAGSLREQERLERRCEQVIRVSAA